MKITFNLTVNDLWNGNKYVYLRAPKLRANLLKSAIVTPLILTIGMLLLKKPLSITVFTSIAAGIIGGCLINIIMIYIAKSNIERKSYGYNVTQTVELKPSGYTSASGGKNPHTAWKNVTEVRQNKDYVFFITSDNSIQIIPKRAFESEQSSQEFYSEAEKYFKGSDKAKKK